MPHLLPRPLAVMAAAAFAASSVACGGAAAAPTPAPAKPTPAKAAAAYVVNSYGSGSMIAVAADGSHVREIPTPLLPTAIVSGAEGVFLVGKTAVVRFDVTTGKFGAPAALPGTFAGPAAATLGGGFLWVVDSNNDALYKLDPRAMTLVATIKVGRAPRALGFAGGTVWVANGSGSSVSIVDVASGKATEDPIACSPTAVAATANTVWVYCSQGLVEYDVNTKRHKGLALQRPSATHDALLATSGALWLLENSNSTVPGLLLKLDIGTGAVLQIITVGKEPLAAQLVGKEIWIANFHDNSVTRVDPATATVTGSFDGGTHVTAVAAAPAG